jgi:hypothetical protein
MIHNGTEVRDESGKVIGHIYGYVEETDNAPAEVEKAAVSEALEEKPKEVKKPAKTTKKTAKK